MTTTRARNHLIAAPDERSELRVGVLAILFAHLCDLVSTYIRTPDLAHEVSPLYLKLGQHGIEGWAVMLGLKGVAVLVSVILFAYYIRQRRSFYPTEAGVSFHDFLHHVHGHKAMRRRDGSWRGPSPKLLMVWMAFTVSIGSAAYAYFLAVHNIMNMAWLSWMADAAAPGVIFMVMAIVFWYTLHVDYLHETHRQE